MFQRFEFGTISIDDYLETVKHPRRDKRLRTIVAQSRDCTSILHNLEIAQVHCTISRSRNYSAQSRDSENAQRNLEIAHKFPDCAEHIVCYD